MQSFFAVLLEITYEFLYNGFGDYMKYKQNLHTHSNFCDGVDTPEELVKAAIEKGFSSLGFSGHSFMHFSPKHSMSIEGTERYKKEVNRLKEKYSEHIDIFCGLEFDELSEIPLSGYDYLIGSVHYFLINGEYVGFDRDAAAVRDVVNNYFGGDGMKYAEAYYTALSKLPEYGQFDIIGHFDLITKHCENVSFFDESSPRYLQYALIAAESLAGKIPFFEVNTGAIARGYRTTPYPSIPILNELKRLGYGAVISSDCHNKNMLDCAFDDAVRLLKYCGFNEYYYLTENGFKAVELP